MLDYAKRTLGLKRVVAIVSPANHRSTRILERIGLRFERTIQLPGDDEKISLYASDAQGGGAGPETPHAAGATPTPPS